KSTLLASLGLPFPISHHKWPSRSEEYSITCGASSKSSRHINKSSTASPTSSKAVRRSIEVARRSQRQPCPRQSIFLPPNSLATAQMESASVKQIVVLYPVGGIGHVGPMTQLAKVFLDHGYDVTMVLIEPPIKSTDSGADFIERVAAPYPSITFHVLPPIPPPDLTSSTKHPFLLILELMRRYNDKLESFLRSIPRERLHSLVIDLFCTHAIDIATKVGVPVYKFFASGAGTLAVFTQLPALLSCRQTGLKELGDTPLEFLGVPPMPASHLVKSLLENPEDELCRTMMKILKRNADTHGVLVNTFESLESRALQALRDPLCVPGQILPPVYPIGPLVGKGGTDKEKHECLAWLDAQQERSVVFLCWGSKGALPKEQLMEIAVGLENSGQRFLWVVRTPAGSDEPKRYWEQRAEADLGALLPEGFLERIKGRGLVIKSWAPQVDVLGHRATGAFVTHCGWNSTLEAVAAGVPMLCWPLAAAEQKMNKVFITDDMGIGVEMEGYKAGFIRAEEIEAKVRLVLECKEGRELRKRAIELKKAAQEAMEDGGSSRAAFLQFLSDVKNLRE
ncbi:UDP-glycosyltransferase 88A1, partial [Setaria italica]